MILRCRTCGRDNRLDPAAATFICDRCNAPIDPNRVKMIDPQVDRIQTDPLEDFR
jgi:DNA-directed RNA polymerase subunit RPC12/RpoP